MNAKVVYYLEHEKDNRDAVTIVLALELRNAVREFRRKAHEDGRPHTVEMLDAELRRAGVISLIVE